MLAAFGGRASAADNQCASCHPTETERHGGTRHARALQRPDSTAFVRALPDGPIGEARNGFLLSYRPQGSAIEVSAARGKDQASARIEWIFGAAAQGQTPVAFAGGKWLEHRISYYPQRGRFDLTLGHQPGASTSAEAALGVVQPETVIRNCFSCHATLAEGELRVEQAGVGCSRCHSGAADHAAKATKVGNPGKLSAKQQVELCAECHRLTPVSGNDRDPLNIRFQPLRLVKSKCFQTGKLSCTSCHAAHQDASRETANYVQVCRACHEKPHNPGTCIECHMPRSSPAPYLIFTDHWIRRK